ncbi:zinc finger protein 507 isoform X2 [Bombina bombina]|nr:zinc finger protein 507 isoform X2 [Bombina bombina]XP_053557711.1 zinc finger protein 507 isoform X2 [Bombina bombina]
MDKDDSIAVMLPNLKDSEAQLIHGDNICSNLLSHDNIKCSDPLINVIQKLTEMVENGKSSRIIEARKRSYPLDSSLSQESCTQSEGKESDDIGHKKYKGDTQADNSEIDSFLKDNKKVMFYQCSLCKFLSQSFESLKAHVQNHGQQNEIVLMCSECYMTFKTHSELECHIKKHLENEKTTSLEFKDHPQKDIQISNSSALPGQKKWYAHEEYGLYRCLICRYTCGQQRMLKTHAWKHAGEVDCSYPIFEEDNESADLPDSTVAHAPQGSESVLLEDIESKPLPKIHECGIDQMQESLPLDGTVKGTDILIQTATPAPMTEVVVAEDVLSDTDSLLSSAHEIISCSQTKKGHVNVIVERLPSAEETVSQKSFLIDPEVEVKNKNTSADSQLPFNAPVDHYHPDKNVVANEEIIIGWSTGMKSDDENYPPVRRRTNSECLRLHSLAAEALVTMPIRVVECPKSSLQIINDPNSLDPDTGQQDSEVSYTIDPKIMSSRISEDLNSFVANTHAQNETKEKIDVVEAPIKKGISISLLKVIEKLRERTDQNASDDDILKELQDNAQCESANDLNLGSNLVEYLPDAERPYRCRLCHYTSDNKGYIKQHLRIHRQRQPYQCPICEHTADNSEDLENHMINHCKTTLYECKQCAQSFYYKGQLRTHEREFHSLPDPDCQTLSPSNNEKEVGSDDEEKYSTKAEGDKSSTPKMYGCDMCNYKSPTYIGVRNHRRIHNAERPYRCQVCNFTTTNMNSLKCHVRRHPDDNQSVHLVDQYRCSLCGYVCSHPPSLKSHMWKHASDQNYNYEQVNKAINEAMSQSSRVPAESQTKKISANSVSRIDHNLRILSSSLVNEGTSYIEMPKVNPAQVTLCTTEKLQTQMRPGTELCVLLFCCCICGFEYTSKELLMEHMKAHEGEIINIILNKSESSS